MATDYIQEFKDAVPKVIAKAWSDPGFESLLITNANQAFAQFGVNLPSSFDLRVVKNDAAPSSGGWVLTEAGGRQIMTLPLPPQGSSSGGATAAAACSSSSTCCTA